MHKDARPSAEAALCVNEQGSDKFFKFHDVAFKNQDKLDPPNLEKFAKDAGADVKKYKACIAGQEVPLLPSSRTWTTAKRSA